MVKCFHLHLSLLVLPNVYIQRTIKNITDYKTLSDEVKKDTL